MIFVCSELLEKGRKHSQLVNFAFNDFRKAFDTVNRGLLFSILIRSEHPQISISLLEALLFENAAVVRVGGKVLIAFQVTKSVK